MTLAISAFIGLCAFTLFLRILFTPSKHVKCNVSSNGDKIYHLPGDKFYASVKIDKSKGECIVRTETEAMELGFRRSKIV